MRINNAKQQYFLENDLAKLNDKSKAFQLNYGWEGELFEILPNIRNVLFEKIIIINTGDENGLE